MQIINIKFYEGIHLGQFTIFVLGQEVYRAWVENAYSFNYKNGNVYFSAGGVEDRFAGKASDREEITKIAIEYLELWLKECRAIGQFELYNKVKIHHHNPRGESYFGIQISKNIQHDRIFYFHFEDKNLYYLGNDENPTRELVKFIYKARKDKVKKELFVYPKNKEEAIQDAIDYLEWRNSMKNL